MTPIRKDLSMTAQAVAWPDAPNRLPSRATASARLSQAEYEGWLLPPEPRDGIERVVHALSLTAGIFALTAFSLGLWLVS